MPPLSLQEGGGVPIPTAAGMVNADGTPLTVDPKDLYNVPQGGVFNVVRPDAAICE